MNVKQLFYGILGCFLFLFPSLAGASTTITDSYWGGKVYNASATAYGDVIGAPEFSIDSMTVTKLGTTWTVAITGQYFLEYKISGSYPSTLGPGDLYINSNGWIADKGASNYATDTFNSSEGWNYVVTQNAAGVWGLYSLNYSDITYTSVAPYNPDDYIFRTDQAWRGGDSVYIGAATYSLSGDTLTFTFNTGNLNFTDEVGFHWTMQCGNDVIEGKVEVPTTGVPEPATLLLLGFGLIGLAGIRRKSKS